MKLLTALAVILLVACNDQPSMATRSAAAYRAHPTTGGHEHGHSAGAKGDAAHMSGGHSTHVNVDHSAHATANHSAHAPADHSAHMTTDHSAHATPDDHAAHATAQASADPSSAAHTHHPSSTAAPATLLTAPRTNAETGALQPRATLRPDSFDTPAPVSESEAAKASGAGHAGHGGLRP
ncbi:MAG TPA: hypothetical protein VHW00_18225 [Thermoanaerobaculia bacterium]|nr:hypothetical protein [Thermoanaerobaculia bacterium]